MAIIMSESARQRMGIAAPKVTRYVAPPKVDASNAPKVKRARKAKVSNPAKGKVDSCGNRCFPIPFSERMAAGPMPRRFADLKVYTPDLSTPSGVRGKAYSEALGSDVFKNMRQTVKQEILNEL